MKYLACTLHGIIRCFIEGWPGTDELNRTNVALQLDMVTLRQPLTAYASQGLFDSANAFGGVDVRTADAVERVLVEFQPQAVVNAIGIVKQRPEVEEAS